MPTGDGAVPPAAELVGVTKRFGDVVANDGIDLAIARGEVHGVVGENGAGKSTLMSILYGLHRPDAGHVLRDGRRVRLRSPADAIAHGLGMVHQRFRLFPELSVAENVVIGAEPTRRGMLDLAAAGREVERLGELYGLRADPRARVGRLPVGVRQRVEILKALYRGARVLILDEPTAVLTPGEAARLFEVLRTVTRSGVSVVLVTHKLGEVLTATDRVTVLRGGRVTGRFTTSGTTAAELVVAMIGRSPAAAPARRSPTAERAPYALEVDGLTVRDRDGVVRLAGVSFGVRPGEIVGLAGVAGSGQRELVDAVTGLRTPGPGDSGRVLLSGRTVRGGREPDVAYVPEDRHGRGTAAAMSLRENLVMGDQRSSALRGRFGLSSSAVRDRARALVESFGIRAASVDAPISTLSGGNAQKAVLARELSRPVGVIVVEEPTQGVDVGAQEMIHGLLAEARDRGRAVLLQSSELTELRALSDRVLVLYEGRLVAEVPGDEATDERLGAAMTGAPASADAPRTPPADDTSVAGVEP
ncbi:ABC transporter ATP-binding protein [Microbispora corallina]|uniref:Heme ABC transporter ATP-binding protein n=1 Tax=Microbispora corallina TaxID=83302 RepID=A0ABQ4FR83_9ACTN|nr:ABC transporter ATP-binding protein [Microbispora corallina]GIH37328.1 heme ABC transporter ATP-binding protein [Microbispora corallina]